MLLELFFDVKSVNVVLPKLLIGTLELVRYILSTRLSYYDFVAFAQLLAFKPQSIVERSI